MTFMKVLLANPRGFCAGVNMAIECLDETIRRVGPGIFVYHEIVHNKYVVDRFTRQGVKFVDTLKKSPTAPSSCSVLMGSHRKSVGSLANENSRPSMPRAHS